MSQFTYIIYQVTCLIILILLLVLISSYESPKLLNPFNLFNPSKLFTPPKTISTQSVLLSFNKM